MKKTLLSVIFGLSAFSAFAGGVENKSNMSTGYLRNPSRNAECERPEAAFYNIAGTAFLSLILLKTAISEPVHAPVPGRGIPTNSISTINEVPQRG